MNDTKANRFIAIYSIPATVMADWLKTDENTRKADEEKMKAEWQKWTGDHAKMITADRGLRQDQEGYGQWYNRHQERYVFVFGH